MSQMASKKNRQRQSSINVKTGGLWHSICFKVKLEIQNFHIIWNFTTEKEEEEQLVV